MIAREVPAFSWFVLLVLGLIYTQQQWSRYSLNYLYNVSQDDDFVSIKHADSISYTEYGILTGYGFSGTFCLAGLVAGRAADISSRKLIIFTGIFAWNVALLMIGYSHSYLEVLLWRLVLGFGQAFSSPASYSLIADYFPESQRSQANGLFACGVYIGGGMASMCISMSADLGWRNTCFLIATIGFCISVIEVVSIREPQRPSRKSKLPALNAEGGHIPAAAKKNFVQAIWAIFSNELVVLVFAASSLRYMGGYVIAGYLPALFASVFPNFDDQYSYINAYVVAGGGFISSWLGGMLADKWRAVEPRARMYLPVCGCFGSLPFMAICCLASDFYVSIFLGLFVEYLIAECWFGPVVATMQSALEADCRALAIACFTLIATFFGSLASYILGYIYDAMLARGYPDTIIRWLVLWSVVTSYVFAGALFLYCATLTRLDTLVTQEKKPLLRGKGLFIDSSE